MPPGNRRPVAQPFLNEETEKEITMKQLERARPLTLDRPPPLNSFRSIAVAVALCVAFAAAVYLAIG
jgi:hypothetical protein